jgi:DNA-binding transcriptional MerR regulator
VLDADEIAQEVNKRSGDVVSARMVREYVRLGILDKALHPGRRGFDDRAVNQMIQARGLVREGLSLKAVGKRMRAQPQRRWVHTKDKDGAQTWWIDFGKAGWVGIAVPKSMGEEMTGEVVGACEEALKKLVVKNKVRSNEDV